MHLGLQPQGLAREDILIGISADLTPTGFTTLRHRVPKEDAVSLSTCLKATATIMHKCN